MSGTVIKFHLKCNIYSITSKLTIDLTLNYVKIFEFQNGSTRKLTYNKVYGCLENDDLENEDLRPRKRRPTT